MSTICDGQGVGEPEYGVKLADINYFAGTSIPTSSKPPRIYPK
ncbi:MAG TPA: hypothetical protein VE980_16875 [Pyrinomonadaceae bacterium]|nr:hypothetical protein [Pyrinomonadaceae bacterium]